jgi:hypothetical protein
MAPKIPHDKQPDNDPPPIPPPPEVVEEAIVWIERSGDTNTEELNWSPITEPPAADERESAEE